MGQALRSSCAIIERKFTVLRWYNTEHRHGNLSLLTPADVHYGRGEAILNQRSQTLLEAFANRPQRFEHRAPSPGSLPREVWINRPKIEEPSSLTFTENPGPEQVFEVTKEPGSSELPVAETGRMAVQLCGLKIAHSRPDLLP